MIRWKTASALFIAGALAANCTDEPTRPPAPFGPSAQLLTASNSRIAFQSLRDYNPEIYVMNTDGSGQTRITNSLYVSNAPAWAPDGLQIAFTSDRQGLYEQIYVINADGSAVTRLTHDPSVDHSPSWSLDGRIAFASVQSGSWDIHVMNEDGSAQAHLAGSPAIDVEPTWSPDGRRIAFTSTRDGNSEIYVMNVDGSAQTRLTNDPAADNMSSWSPDGQYIAFTSARDGNQEIYLMNADGSSQTRLTSDLADDNHPSWSPDGRQIAFASSRDGQSEIYVMNADGSVPTRLITLVGSAPVWSPEVTNGTTLSFVTQPPQSVGVGTVMSPPVQVAVQDALGNTVAGARNAVTLALAVNPGGATLLGTSTVRAVDGVATFADLRVDRPGNGYQLRTTAPNLGGAMSESFTVTAAGTLEFVAQPPPDVAADSILSPPVRVALQDSLGQLVSGAIDTVTLALAGNPTGARLLGRTTVAVVDGVATFADLHVDRPGTGYTLVATAAGRPGATSAPFAVHVTFTAVTTGNLHSCGVSASGAAYCWGYNVQGQVGDGTTTARATPAPIAGGLTFAEVNAGGYHTCGVTTSGAAYCWGYNTTGQLGDGTMTSTTSPVPVAGGLTFTMVSAGFSHTCGVTTSGAAYCWGDNVNGQIGDGTQVDRPSPVPVAGGLTFTTVDAGGYHTCGVTSHGLALCWGANGYGQLGDGSMVSRPLPGPVVGVPRWSTITAGYWHTCGVRASGEASCWGYNNLGE